MLIRKLFVISLSTAILSCASVSAQNEAPVTTRQPAAAPVAAAPVVSPGSSYKTIRSNCVRSIRLGNYWDGDDLQYHAVVELFKGSEGRLWIKFTDTGMKATPALGTPSYLSAEQWLEFAPMIEAFTQAKAHEQLINVYTYGPNVSSVETGVGNLCKVEEDD